MTTAVATRFRALAFGDVEGSVWGAAVQAGDPALVFGASGETARAAGIAQLQWSDGDGGWRLAGAGFDLHVEPVAPQPGEPIAQPPGEPTVAPAGEGVNGVEELCRVRGTISAAGSELPVDCVGTRFIVDGIDAGALASVRAVSGWFGDDHALALLAFRSRGSAGQESDLIGASLFDPEGWVAVQDPRLSTTYAESGLPARANLELWIGDGETEFPRRASAEATGSGAAVAADGFELRVLPLRCHSRGLDGAGVYALIAF